MYKPRNVRTQERTVYSQFLNKDPLGQDETMTMSLDVPCNLWPVVASLVFTGNWVIWHVNFNRVLAMWWGLQDTSVVNF